MATVTGVARHIVVPFDNSGSGQADEQGLLAKLATLVGSTANLIIPDVVVSYISFYNYAAGAFHFNRGIQFDLFCTTAGDPLIVANLATYQTATGVSIATWSETISYGW